MMLYLLCTMPESRIGRYRPIMSTCVVFTGRDDNGYMKVRAAIEWLVHKIENPQPKAPLPQITGLPYSKLLSRFRFKTPLLILEPQGTSLPHDKLQSALKDLNALIAHGAILIICKFGGTPLHGAACCNSILLVQYFLDEMPATK